MHRFASPAQFTRISAVVLPVAMAVAVLCGTLGLYLGLIVAPEDYQQGAMVKIMYIHVPAAWMASATYAFMAVMSASFLIWRHTLADVLAREAAPIGAVFTLITLITGMLWGKPTWGAYWVWDARLTSMLVLLLLYAGYLGVAMSGEHSERVKVASAWIALVGALNLPIIKYSVEWWNSLHQGASILRRGGPSIDPSMLSPLLLMIGCFTALFIVLLLVRADTALKAVKLRRLQIQRIALKNAAMEEGA
ncbi:MAG: heme ABC transporter permease CcmC [Alphaproteobacteria bacterium]|nr:heme ABC transporter permease CcmC [Alphaproteobacteria bacterium]